MERFMGLMPRNEIEKEVTYTDMDNFKIKIQACPHGWTIIWADGGVSYGDVEASTEENFEEALRKAKDNLGELTLCEGYGSLEVSN